MRNNKWHCTVLTVILCLGVANIIAVGTIFFSYTGAIDRAVLLTQDKVSFESPLRAVKIAENPLQKEDSNEESHKVHVMYGLSGNSTDVFSEFEVSLKSLLLNAPVDYPLAIHLLVDGDAKKGVETILSKAQLEGSHWRHSIAVNLYDVSKDDEHFMRDNIRFWRNQSSTFGMRK